MKENARIEAFSDGVFAIAISLLILELRVPPHDSVHSVADLWKGLIDLWPSYFAFLGIRRLHGPGFLVSGCRISNKPITLDSLENLTHMGSEKLTRRL